MAAYRSAAALSPAFDSLTEAGRAILAAGRPASEARPLFAEALSAHAESPYPALNLALLDLRAGERGGSEARAPDRD